MEYFTENKELRGKFKEIQKKEIITECEFCGKRIVRNRWNKKYQLINVCQQPKRRFFCSSQCKLNWIFDFERALLT
jgi:hypothetical protein